MAIIQPQINIKWLTLLVITTALFAILCCLVHFSNRFNEYEEWLQQQLIHQQNHWWWHVIAVVFDPKTIVAWDCLLAGYLLMIGNPARAIYVLVMLATVDAFGIWIKHLLKRQRPTAFDKLTLTYSFPSGHTLGTTILALMVSMLFPRPIIISLMLIVWLLVIICRLTLRAHYPADVVGAILLAISWWIGGELIYTLIMR